MRRNIKRMQEKYKYADFNCPNIDTRNDGSDAHLVSHLHHPPPPIALAIRQGANHVPHGQSLFF